MFNSIINLCKRLLSKPKSDGCVDFNDIEVPRSVMSPVDKSIRTEQVREAINITIHKPIYEYAHGKKFKIPPKWIVIHYTGSANVSAKSMCKSMRNNDKASSHFYIDEKDIYSAVPLKYIAWHVGSGQCSQPDPLNKKTLEELSTYKAKDWRYDLSARSHLKWISSGDDFTGNSVSIGVDICVKKKSTKTKKATDTDWYFEDEAVENLAKTVAYLAKEYSIDIDHIITHCMATGKLCPQVFVWPPDVGDAKWVEFKSKVADYMKNDISVKFV